MNEQHAQAQKKLYNKIRYMPSKSSAVTQLLNCTKCTKVLLENFRFLSNIWAKKLRTKFFFSKKKYSYTKFEVYNLKMIALDFGANTTEK